MKVVNDMIDGLGRPSPHLFFTKSNISFLIYLIHVWILILKVKWQEPSNLGGFRIPFLKSISILTTQDHRIYNFFKPLELRNLSSSLDEPFL